jgi:hypothetical protein
MSCNTAGNWHIAVMVTIGTLVADGLGDPKQPSTGGAPRRH